MTSTHESLIAEDEANRLAALGLASFIVEAPAGAGKTELLTQRYLKLLQTVESPEEIIAITFTNKAAAEMRLRILESLKLALDDVPPPQAHKQITYALAKQALQLSAENQWNLLQNPARLRITTIDAFCGHLARQMPLLSRFGSQPMMSIDASVHYQEAVRRTLEMLDSGGEHGKVVADTLNHLDNNTERLTELLVKMLSQRDQWLGHAQQLDSSKGAEAALCHLLAQDLAQAATVLPPSLQAQLMPLVRFAAANLPEDAPIALMRDWDVPLEADLAMLPAWRVIADFMLTGTNEFRKEKGLNVRNGFPATDEGRANKAVFQAVVDAIKQHPSAEQHLSHIRKLPSLEGGEESWHLVATFAHLLNLAVAHLWTVFQEAGEVDFIGVAQRALQALEDETGATDLAMKLDYRISHLLVDEFQDTSPTQVELLRRLTRGWLPDDGRTLFCVGDPMQSIYRFRKADVGLFLQVAESGIDHIRLDKLKLYRNNRSCPQVVDWINQAFGLAFPQQDSVARGAISYRPFVAGKPVAEDGGVQVHPVLAARNTSKLAAEMLEAIQVANIIEAEQHEYPGRTIAVLVRARDHLTALVTEIRRARPNIKFQAVEIETLSGRQSVQDVLALTHALHHRADRVNWLAILRAPWCGLTLADMHVLAADDHDATIWSLMQDEARLAKMSVDGQARLRHTKQVLMQALLHQGRQSTRRWVESVWLLLNGPACLWDTGDVRDVQAFFDLIESLDAGNGFSLTALEEGMQKLYAAPDAQATETLQFMTIHKSKGLEFDTVILPGLDRGNAQQDQPLLLWEEVSMPDATLGSTTELIAAPLMPKGSRQHDLPTPYDYLQGLEKERAQNESLRVLYVAATRAERKLHLLGIAKLDEDAGGRVVKEPTANTHLSHLWQQVGAYFMQAAAVTQPDEWISAEEKPTLASFTPQLMRLKQVGKPELFQAIVTKELARDSKLFGESLAKSPPVVEDHHSLEKNIGILAHRYVELIAQSGLEAWNIERLQTLKPAMQGWFQQAGHDAKQAEQGAVKVLNALCVTLDSEQGRWVLQARETARAELALTTIENGDASTRVIDRTFIENGERWIIDYKSAPLNADLNQEAIVQYAEQYRTQLEAYAALFVGEGLPIKKAILFLGIGKLAVLD